MTAATKFSQLGIRFRPPRNGSSLVNRGVWWRRALNLLPVLKTDPRGYLRCESTTVHLPKESGEFRKTSGLLLMAPSARSQAA